MKCNTHAKFILKNIKYSLNFSLKLLGLILYYLNAFLLQHFPLSIMLLVILQH